MRRCFVVAIILFSTIFRNAAFAQNGATLTISSPANGTVVQPGQVLQIAVAATNPDLLKSETIIGEDPLGMTSPQLAASQLVFNLAVPNAISPGTYIITAVGALQKGGIAAHTPGASVAVVVPIPSTVTALRSDLSPMQLSYPGDQLPLVVTGVTNQGTLTVNSQSLSFVSNNPNIASVDANGIVTAQAPGQTQLTISYPGANGTLSATVSVQVLGGVRGDLNGDGKVDVDDLNILGSELNMPATGPNDGRDLNHDGVINTLDAQILTALCTNTQCATRSGSSLAIGAAAANPNTLWPPNHAMVPVTVTVPTSGGSGAASCRIAWVGSNEPIDPGGDWIVTGNLTLSLVADRLGTGTGRVYTIEVECTDASRATVASSIAVTVPHDQGH